MAKVILLSIHPKWAEKIYSGNKTIEWRRTSPRNYNDDYKVYLYETAPVSKVTGFIEIDDFDPIDVNRPYNYDLLCQMVEAGRVDKDTLKNYQGNRSRLIAWEIGNYHKFNTPKTLSDFCIKRPPQSWQYVEDEINGGKK